MRATWPVVLAALAALGVLSACGSADIDVVTTGSPTATEPRAPTGSPTSTATGPQGPSPDAFVADRALPRFRGDLLGMYIAPPDDPVPSGYEAACDPASQHAAASWAQMGDLDTSSLKLPAGYIASNNPEDGGGPILCGDQPYGGGLIFTLDQPNGFQAKVYIDRNYDRYIRADAPRERIMTTKFGEHDAIVVKPVIPDGRQTISQVVFPGTTITQIYALDLSFDNLTALADSVAGQLR